MSSHEHFVLVLHVCYSLPKIGTLPASGPKCTRTLNQSLILQPKSKSLSLGPQATVACPRTNSGTHFMIEAYFGSFPPRTITRRGNDPRHTQGLELGVPKRWRDLFKCGFPNIRGTILGVLIIRNIIYLSK